MQNFIIRSAVLFFGAILQVSFLSGLISSNNMPFIMVAYVVALTIIREFNRAFLWVITAALIFDSLSYRLPGESAIPLVLISYGVSFISRKIWMSNKLWRWLAISLLGAGGAIFSYAYYLWIQILFNDINFTDWLIYFFNNFHHSLLSALYTVIILMLIYKPLEKLENYLSLYERKTIIKQ